jgi:CheY-like chemotaxis protein
LGLSIAKGLLQLLNSEISVQSQKGKGASFSFSIPFSELKSDAKMQTINKDSVSKIAKHMVLVAEDDDSNRFYLEVILKKSAIGVLIATNGKEAVDQCKLYPEISLVLMDLKMPVMDGFEATREIKAFRSDLPVIAVSAYCMNEEKNDAMEAGCDDYVSKPVDSMFLMNTLKKYGLTAL